MNRQQKFLQQVREAERTRAAAEAATKAAIAAKPFQIGDVVVSITSVGVITGHGAYGTYVVTPAKAGPRTVAREDALRRATPEEIEVNRVGIAAIRERL